MTWDNSKYVKLLLERREDKADKYLIALRTTADYYGWTEKFPAWTLKTFGGDGGYSWGYDPGRRGEMFCEPGRRHRICRSARRQGNPRGMTNAFKLSRNCGLFDISEVAHFTKGDWHWMEGPTGERVSRERWEAMYQAGTPRKRRGLVSV